MLFGHSLRLRQNTVPGCNHESGDRIRECLWIVA